MTKNIFTCRSQWKSQLARVSVFPIALKNLGDGRIVRVGTRRHTVRLRDTDSAANPVLVGTSGLQRPEREREGSFGSYLMSMIQGK